MNFEQLRGRGIFAGKLYAVPEYQRYYEWEVEKEVGQFWEDISNYLYSESPFPLGVFILQESENIYEIVDGQQRLTTLIILLRALIETFKSRGKEATKLEKLLIDPYEEKPTLKVQEQDNPFFENCIIKGKDCQNPRTASQKKIKEAKDFFIKKLSNLSDEELDKLNNLLEERIFVFVIKVSDKKEASYMFELHNSRGKPLSNLDKLKSFILHKLYTENAVPGKINYIYNTFGEIYKTAFEISRLLEDRKIPPSYLSEDEILTGFGNLWSNYNYKFEELKKSIKTKSVEELEKFVGDLLKAFKAVETFVRDDSDYANYIRDYIPLKFNFILPFLMKIYSLELSNREKFLKVLEKLLFVHNLAFTNAWVEYRIGYSLKDLNKNTNVEEFERNLFATLEKENYWSKQRLFDNLRGNMYNDLTRIILKRYEISLNSYGYQPISKSEYIHKEPWELEHIAPRSLEKKQIEGYTKCDAFEERFLNSLGNLLLVSKGHNIALGDRPFKEKLKSYKELSPFKHHKEIEQFSENGFWSCNSIERRLANLVRFVENEWRL